MFGDIFDRVREEEDKVTRTERAFEADPSNNNLCAINRVSAQLLRTLSIEESYWK